MKDAQRALNGPEDLTPPERLKPTRWDRFRVSLGMGVIGHGWARSDLVHAYVRGPHCQRCHIPIDTLGGDYVYDKHKEMSEPDDSLPVYEVAFLCGPCRLDKPLSLAARARVWGDNRFLKKLQRRGLIETEAS